MLNEWTDFVNKLLFCYQQIVHVALRKSQPAEACFAAATHNWGCSMMVIQTCNDCCRPSEVGIDVVVESATKYLNGHADLAAGAVAGSQEFLRKASLFALILLILAPNSIAAGLHYQFLSLKVTYLAQ